MKIAMIHGQNHVGSTCQIGRMLVKKLGDGNQVAEFFLPRDLNHFCMGCIRCIENESECPFYAEKRKIMDVVDDADLLIFTTPTYCMHASAPMKAFLDLTFTYWMSHRPREEMFRKRAVVISTAAGAGTGSAMKDIATALLFWGIPQIYRYGIALQASGWEMVSDKKKAEVEKATDRLARKVRASGNRVGIKTKFLFNMMRMGQKSYDDSPEKRYWKGKGWLDTKRPW